MINYVFNLEYGHWTIWNQICIIPNNTFPVTGGAMKDACFCTFSMYLFFSEVHVVYLELAFRVQSKNDWF